MPSFEQSLDVTRPHTLLTENARFSGSLVYRYDDTGDEVSVPNVWYNQTYHSRVAAIRFEAARQEELGELFALNPPLYYSPAAVADVLRRYLARAAKIRAEAERMEAAGIQSHPVAAARLPIDFGEQVSR